MEIPHGIDPGRNGKSNDGLFGYAIHATFKNLGIQLAASGIIDCRYQMATAMVM